MTQDQAQQNRRNWIWHPVLFALYPIIALFAANRAELGVPELLRPAAVAVFAAALVWAFFALATRHAARGAIMASVILLGCYVCWGAFVKSALYAIGESWDIKIRYLAIGYAAIIAAVLIVAARAKSVPGLTRALNAISLLLVLMSSAQAAINMARGGGAVPPSTNLPFAKVDFPVPANPPQRPNVFFIVLDSYARADVLQHIFAFDNTPFLDRMRQRGFIIPAESRVNYTHTVLSLPACFSMDYLENMGFDESAPDYGGVEVGKLFHFSKVHGVFKDLGYHMAAVTTGFRFTEPQDYYDHIINYDPPWWEPSLFEIKILDFSPALRVLRYAGVDFGHDQWRRRLLYNLNHIPDPVKQQPDKPWFVFAHILAPHAPFVFRPDGSASPPAGVLSLSSDVESAESYETYKRLYAAQVSGLNVHVETMVDNILAASPTPPVIAIVSDHGPKLENVYPEGLKHTLIMLHIPNANPDALHNNMNLVELFPVLFRSIFEMDVPMPVQP